MTSDRPRIQTDFNDLVDGRATAIVAGRVPEVGQVVELFDPDGNTCLAAMEKLDNSVLYMRPFWETWKDGGYVPDLMTALKQSVGVAAGERRDDLQESKTTADPVEFKQYV